MKNGIDPSPQGPFPDRKKLSPPIDAEKWGRSVESEIDRGFYTERTLFADVITRYQSEVLPTKRGKDAELIRIQVLLKSNLARHGMTALNTNAIAAWRGSRLKQVSG